MKKLPFGGEFSPKQVQLDWLLQVAQASESRGHFVEQIRENYYRNSCRRYKGDARRIQQLKRARNVVIGMQNYGLLRGDPFGLTDLGRSLLDAGNETERYRTFARHILVNLHGIEVLNTVDALSHRGDVSKKTLATQLGTQGFDMPRATTKHLIVLAWLRQANVLAGKTGYVIDREVLGALLKTAPDILSALDRLSNNQRCFLRSLARMSQTPGQIVSVSDVIRSAESLYPVRFPQDRIRAVLLRPLEEAGWIHLTGASKGRGAKGGLVQGSDRFESEFVRQLLEEDAPVLSLELRQGLRQPLSRILADVQSGDRFIKGKGLELLALHVSQLLDLRPRQWRLRSAQTGGAEVDLIVEGSRLLFTRWQIQCKNTASVSLEDLAKEIGLAFLLKSQVVMLVTTGDFGQAVYAHARRVNEETYLQVILVNGEMLNKISSDASTALPTLITMLDRQAEETLRHKSPQVFGDE